jgi:hypothetical protein
MASLYFEEMVVREFVAGQIDIVCFDISLLNDDTKSMLCSVHRDLFKSQRYKVQLKQYGCTCQ